MTESAALRLFSSILDAARRYDASDIHLVVGLPPAYRVTSDMVVAHECEPLSREDLTAMAASLLNEAQRHALESRREISISICHPRYGRIRLSLYHRLNAPEMAIRMCNLEIRSAEDLMLPAILRDLVQLTSGLVIVTGPTGMGKTTTMNFMIDLINATRRCRVITIEDPVEYEHRHRKSVVTQIEVGTDTASFSSCLRHVLRLDPDVICVGEMRDLETIETALTAAETGHLVIATLHTPNAVTTVDRITGCFDGERQRQVILQLASTLEAIVAQRLIPTVDKERRVLAIEVLLASTAVRSIIRENRAHQLYNAISSGRREGMIALEESLADLYKRGLISYDQAIVNSVRGDVIKDLLDR
ncbi:MAG: PilT/PilU family type 4a pilus ATPase [Lentisphaeria bacterium]|nr:PilT/PilU family type 4a pilus ATPase [Lentisphaeria bacterium]